MDWKQYGVKHLGKIIYSEKIITSLLGMLIEEIELDKDAHSQGKCSYPVLALCSAEEHRIKNKLKEKWLK